MSKQANKKAIGAFVLAALALGVAAIIIFGSGKFFVKTSEYVAYFKGSVKGLNVGAPVVFRGVKIGQVTKIMIYADQRTHTFEIPVFMEIDPENFQALRPVVENRKQYIQDLIQKGLKAQLQTQSMVTGQLMINIDFYPETPVRLIGGQNIKLPEGVIEIPTIQTPLQKIEKTLEEIPIGEIVNNINSSLQGIERIVTSEELTKSLHYFKQSMGDVRSLAQHLDEKIELMSADLSQTLKDAQNLIVNLNNQVGPLAASIKKTSDTAGNTVRDVGQLTKNINGQVKQLAGDLAKTLQTAQETMAGVNGAIGEGSPLRIQVETAVTELTQAARSIRVLADFLQRNPDALLRGKPRKGGF
jgi:phospholipid/cholesterol/gamma-HCH transport system substrate-binding protein